jgi:cell fate regulator YaaT (PSP1 superfamily)
MKILQIVDILRHKTSRIEAPENIEFNHKDKILVKAERDIFVAELRGGVRTIESIKVDEKLNFVRKLTTDEILDFEKNQEGEIERVQKAQKLADNHKLKMKIFASRVGWKNKIFSFFFIAEQPVDFRGLLKDLIRDFPGRIHLERVNDRDRPEILNIPNHCGKEHCCAILPLSDKTVTLNAVRDQGIMIKGNNKIFGVSGKIKRCMLYEVDTYKENRKYLPHIRQEVKVDGKKGRVVGVDILNKNVRVSLFDDHRVENFPVERVEYENKKIAPVIKKAARKIEINIEGVGI